MSQTLIRNRWLLALCGALYAIISIVFFGMQSSDGPLTFQAWRGAVVLLGSLVLAAGACTIAAGLWRSTTGRCWLLVLNGLALGALGLIYSAFTRFSISFRVIALLIILMAISTGVLELITARTLRESRVAEGWLLSAAGVGSIAFALAFFALGFHWIKIEPGSRADLLWLGAYFGFAAICMLGVALRLDSHRLPPSGRRNGLSPLGSPSPVQ